LPHGDGVDEQAAIRLWRLTAGRYKLIADAKAGRLFEVDEPFKMAFDPVELLDL
jgi:hypothetical protein